MKNYYYIKISSPNQQVFKNIFSLFNNNSKNIIIYKIDK